MSHGSNYESTLMEGFDKGGIFDLGHPLLNRIVESFVKAAGIGAIQAVSREAYLTAVDSNATGMPPDITGAKRHRFPDLKGESNAKSIEALVKSTGKESMQWGLAAGVHTGLTYGLKEARGIHDWKNNAVAGAVTGAVLALTTDDTSHERIMQCAITGAALSTAANLLKGVF
ncbi:hypothetical protein LguiA_001005 [Lonicera macranthoides]